MSHQQNNTFGEEEIAELSWEEAFLAELAKNGITQTIKGPVPISNMAQEQSKTFDGGQDFGGSSSREYNANAELTDNISNAQGMNTIDPSRLYPQRVEMSYSLSPFTNASSSHTPGASPIRLSELVMPASHISTFTPSPMIVRGSYDDVDMGAITPDVVFALDAEDPSGNDRHDGDPNSDVPMAEEIRTVDKPYNEWIFECLLSASNHEMALHDIYQWFIENTPKGQIKNQKGWQNSVRHNLSMNDAFVQGGTIGRAIWRLHEDAVLERTVLPTTRYRNPANRSQVRQAPKDRLDRGRQKAGAAGGNSASKSMAKRRATTGAGIRKSAPSGRHGMQTRTRKTTPMTTSMSAPTPSARNAVPNPSPYNNTNARLGNNISSATPMISSNGGSNGFQGGILPHGHASGTPSNNGTSNNYQTPQAAAQGWMQARYPSISNPTPNQTPYYNTYNPLPATLPPFQQSGLGYNTLQPSRRHFPNAYQADGIQLSSSTFPQQFFSSSPLPQQLQQQFSAVPMSHQQHPSQIDSSPAPMMMGTPLFPSMLTQQQQQLLAMNQQYMASQNSAVSQTPQQQLPAMNQQYLAAQQQFQGTNNQQYQAAQQQIAGANQHYIMPPQNSAFGSHVGSQKSEAPTVPTSDDTGMLNGTQAAAWVDWNQCADNSNTGGADGHVDSNFGDMGGL